MIKKITYVLSLVFVSSVFVYGLDTLLNVEIIPGAVTIESPTALSFANPVTASFDSQLVSEDFTASNQYFAVLDLKGADAGYNTTLQLSGNLVSGPNNIPAANVSFKATATSPTLLSGSANTNVIIDSNAASYQALSSARSFIKRNTAANNGIIGKYGSHIGLQVNVPAFQAVGEYEGTLVYTLIEN